MIIDKLENSHKYYVLGDNFKKAFEYLKNTNIVELENGKHVLDGDNLFVSVQDYYTKSLEDCKFEAHKKYIDIQYIAKGFEKLGYANIDECLPTTTYDENADITFLDCQNDKQSFVNADEGYFVIFMPQDAHMPCVSVDEAKFVKKAVVKIKIS